MTKITVRKMQIGDHVDLKKNIFTDMPIEVIEKNVEDNSKAMKDGSTNWTYFVAEADKQIVGTMYLEHKSKSINKHIGELFSVVTASNYRGQGVCKELFNEVSKYALDKGIEKIILTVRGGTIAETVYQKMGFIKYGSLPNGIKEKDSYADEAYYYYKLK